MTTIDLIRKYAGQLPAREIARLAGVKLNTIHMRASRAGISLKLPEKREPGVSMDQFLRRPA